ncbi:MAG: 4-hydroxythreonine-4-phosphate dehydrogenase PdxA [Caulobacteraceae bacterium]
MNITVGLPVVRTSVDHGTAFDIAGNGQGRRAQPAGSPASGYCLGAGATVGGINTRRYKPDERRSWTSVRRRRIVPW